MRHFWLNAMIAACEAPLLMLFAKRERNSTFRDIWSALGREFWRMRLRGWIWLACAAVVAAVAFAVWKPDTADRWAPRVAGLAHGLHDRIWPPRAQTAAAQPKAPPPVNVTVAAVKRADFPVILQGLGQVQAYNTVTVRARVDGQIMDIAFKEGQMVKKGDLLAEIDPRPFQASLEAAKAKRVQDEANLSNAKLDQARYASLAKQNYATQQQLDT